MTADDRYGLGAKRLDLDQLHAYLAARESPEPPLIVTKDNVLVYGHRQVREAELTGHTTLPAIVVDIWSPRHVPPGRRLSKNHRKLLSLRQWCIDRYGDDGMSD